LIEMACGVFRAEGLKAF